MLSAGFLSSRNQYEMIRLAQNALEYFPFTEIMEKDELSNGSGLCQRLGDLFQALFCSFCSIFEAYSFANYPPFLKSLFRLFFISFHQRQVSQIDGRNGTPFVAFAGPLR